MRKVEPLPNGECAAVRGGTGPHTRAARISRTANGDDDHGLVGEGLEQIDLSVGERPHLSPPDKNCTDCFASANERNSQYCAVAEPTGNLATLRILLSLSLQIGNLKRLSIEDGTTGKNPTREG
jgi:hypothetical protein